MRIAALSLLACAACAVAGQVNIGDVRVVDEGKIGTWWQLADGVRIGAPGYPEQALAGQHDACIVLGYLIQPDGHTADHVVVKRWSDAARADDVPWEQFGKAASGELSAWQFAPRPGSGKARPTFTVATFAFSARGGDTAPLRAHCAIEDVGDAVAIARHDAYDRGSLNREWLDRAYRETMRREIRANQANRCRLSHSMAENCID